MIITRTPFRISFFGGGTDYPAWYREHGGAVLAATINKYCYLTCRYLPPFFEHRYRVVYSRIESTFTIDQIKHPSVRETLRWLNFSRGVEIHHDGDVPARSGMGSSSAFTVGLLNALHALSGNMCTKQELTRQAIELEQNRLGETVGSQDQVSAAYGGFNHILFHPSDEISVRPVIMPAARQREFTSHLMLCYTGIKRTSSDIASSYAPKLEDKRRQLRILKDMVDEAISILSSDKPLDAFGELLHEGWLVKRSLSESISNSEIDSVYETARRAGALGGKITGAGGGGFLLLFAPPERHAAIKQAIGNVFEVPFDLEAGGSQVIFYDHEEDYSMLDQEAALLPERRFREANITHAEFNPATTTFTAAL